MATPVMLVVACLAALPALAVQIFLRTRIGQQGLAALNDYSASGPFGRVLVRDNALRIGSQSRLRDRAKDMLAEWARLPARVSVDVERGFSQEACCLASALTPPVDPEDEAALRSVTAVFAYAALTAAERIQESHPSLAVDMLAPHVHSRVRVVRRRMQCLMKALGNSRTVTASST